MASSGTCSRTIIMLLAVLTISTLNVVTGKPERRERHVTDDEKPSHQRSDAFVHSSPNALTRDGSEEYVGVTVKRVSQRLMGGHMRYETTTVSPIDSANKKEASDSEEKEWEEEEKEEDSDEATWDDGMAISSAGNGKERGTKTGDDDDEKKTLSQQVKEGKYGLIQNEIYPKRPKRPGIISYLSNPEVPRDNAKNLGGLDEDEIWLAENHVLVLRGGNFPDHERDNSGNNGGRDNDDWKPIDDYKAPKRQVKIPSRPKIPPPFPIQLTDDGPVRIIGVNDTSSDEASTSDYENEPRQSKGSLSSVAEFIARNDTASKDLASQENTTKKLIEDKEQTDDASIKSGHVPPRPQGIIGPFYPSLPPGAVFVVPPSNHSDYDEDDQSIYYPPPYSFYYKQDNSTPVPPGPLVPGIILPPPPDFFSGLEEKKPNAKTHQAKYPKRTGTTPSSVRATATHYPPRKLSSKANKVTTSRSTIATNKNVSRGTAFSMKPLNVIKYKTTTARSTIKPIHVQDISSPFVGVTTPTISEASNLEITGFYTPRPNDFVDSIVDKTTTRSRTTKKSKNRWDDSVSSKPVPLVTYYSSSTPTSILEPIEATPISLNNAITTGKQRETTNQASYYFYEEANDDVVIGTTPDPTIYYRATTVSPYYNEDEIDQREKLKNREREKNSYELLDSVPKTSPRYQYVNSGSTANSLSSSRSKGHRMIVESSPIYYNPITERSRTSKLQSYYPTTTTTTTTTKTPNYRVEDQRDERYDYEQLTKPKPVYQYSYEAADYYKRGHQQPKQQENYYRPENQPRPYYKQESTEPTRAPERFDEWQDIRDENQQNQQYDYEDSEVLTERPAQPERGNNNDYRNRLPVSYPTSTSRPLLIEPTPNPHHAYYTRQDEQLLDDVTKEYFTNFGKKIRGESLPNTTPIYGKTRVVTTRPDYAEIESFGSNDYDNSPPTNDNKGPRVKVHYGDQAQRPYSLDDDVQVNYKNPLPSIEPESEWIPGYEPKQRVNSPIQSYRQHHTEIHSQDYTRDNVPAQRLTPFRHYSQQRIISGSNGSPTNFVPIGDSREDERRNYPQRPLSLEDDIAVNYRDPVPPINPDAEYIDSPSIANANNNNNNPDKASYFAYRLPGDSGHFYFLTPQAISQRQDPNDGYLYQRPRVGRFSRQRRRGPRNA